MKIIIACLLWMILGAGLVHEYVVKDSYYYTVRAFEFVDGDVINNNAKGMRWTAFRLDRPLPSESTSWFFMERNASHDMDSERH
jgi:hypothetical protein